MKRILAVLLDKKVRLQIFSGMSSWFGAVQLPVQLMPINPHGCPINALTALVAAPAGK